MTLSSEPPAKRNETEQSEIANLGEGVTKIQDTLGREHIPVNRTGNGYVFYASSQTNPSTIEAHVSDFLSIFESVPGLKKYIFSPLCDPPQIREDSLFFNENLHYLGALEGKFPLSMRLIIIISFYLWSRKHFDIIK